MDITLERILSLLPKKPDGKYVHGSKKQFAESLGLSHNLVTMWEKGQSQSYHGYLYEISEKYNVSVAWLKGETDVKEKTVPIYEDGLSKWTSTLTRDELERISAAMAEMNEEGRERAVEMVEDLAAGGRFKKHCAVAMDKEA